MTFIKSLIQRTHSVQKMQKLCTKNAHLLLSSNAENATFFRAFEKNIHSENLHYFHILEHCDFVRLGVNYTLGT